MGAALARTEDRVEDGSDEEWLDRVRRGEPSGATLLFEKYSASLVRFTDRMLGNRAEAEEVAQEVFVKMISRADQYDGRASVGSWLFAIATNACRDRLRRSIRRTSVPLEAVAEAPAPVTAPPSRGAPKSLEQRPLPPFEMRG